MNIKKPHFNIYTRIAVSNIPGAGVGVFAICDIPKDTNLFEGDQSQFLWFDEMDLEIEKQPHEIQKLYEDFCVKKIEANKTKWGFLQALII